MKEFARMLRHGVGPYVLMPVLALAGLVWAVQRFDGDRQSVLFSENGFVELGTAVSFFIAALLALRLAYVGRNSIASKYRLLFALFAIVGCFVSLEELSYGQHLFGWTGPSFFQQHNTKREINLHNLYDNSISNLLRQVANISFPAGLILLPVAAQQSQKQLDASCWAYYLLPKTELITTTLIAQLVSPLDDLSKLLVGVNMIVRPGEVQELYWSVAAAMHMWVLNRRILGGVARANLLMFSVVDVDQSELSKAA